MIAALANSGYSLKFASNALRDDKEVVMAAIKNDGSALEFASEKLYQTSAQDLPNLIPAKRSLIRHYIGIIQSQNPANSDIEKLHGILGHQLQFFQASDQELLNQLFEIITLCKRVINLSLIVY